MNSPTTNSPSESVYHEFHPILLGYVRSNFKKISMFAEEVADDAFLDFWKYRAQNKGWDVLQVLTRYARNRAVSLIRAEEALKKGGPHVDSFDRLREDGFEPREDIFGGNWRTGGRESEQVLCLEYRDQLALADKVLSKAIPSLLEKELILARHIRRWVPDELSLRELAEKLSPSERLRFRPQQKRSLKRNADEFIIVEVGRARGRLQRTLCEIRREMGI